jgi:ribonucleoside-triphosphate reductase
VSDIAWGPTGEVVYNRTYSRPKPDGSKETWPETVERVVDGNLKLGGGKWIAPGERQQLVDMMTEFKILPAGRHLWASGVAGRQYLFNCHVSGWGEDITEHFEFTFMRLMEGGGVGANYSNSYLEKYGPILGEYEVHIVCDPAHPDYQKLEDAGVLSRTYDSEWPGSFEVEDSREGWAAGLVDLVGTYYREAKNRNRVFDVSRVRGEGARLKTFGGRASGPLPLAVMLREVSDVLNGASQHGMLTGLEAMGIDHAIAKCVVSGGNRRSARMAIMHWADPQIFDFLRCKASGDKHWTTNISVEVDDSFWWQQGKMDAYHAHSVLRGIAEGMLTNGEPGVWNSSYANVGEPNPVIATNPCGEIALEAWENCNLGHINLAAFVKPGGTVDEFELYKAHELMTRFLIRATYGDVNDLKQAETLARNRRIGVGHLGYASFQALRGVKYSDGPDDNYTVELLQKLANFVDLVAREYANHLRIPIPVKLRTVAPTGTIAKMPGVSEGIHPTFAKYFIRRIRFSLVDPEQRDQARELQRQGYEVENDLFAPSTVVVSIPTKDSLLDSVASLYGAEFADEVVQSPAELTLADMLATQVMYQTYWADNAVSYTVNIDPDAYTLEDLEAALLEFGDELKGTTVFPEKSFPQAPYERITKEQFESYSTTAVEDSIDEDCATGACPVR